MARVKSLIETEVSTRLLSSGCKDIAFNCNFGVSMKTRLLPWAFAFVLTAVATEAIAADAELCRKYANGAVGAYKNTQKYKKCSIQMNARWQPNYDNHYKWCLGVQASALGAEQKARNDYLRRCGALATPMSNPVGVPVDD